MKPEAIQLLSNAGMYGPAVIFPLILQDEFGASKSTIGLIAGGFAAAGFISSYMFGRASDIHGKRKVLLLGLILSGLATVIQAASILWGGLPVVAVVRILVGFTSGMFPAALMAYAYEARSKMGKFSAWGAAGWGVGNLSVGLFGIFYEGAYLYCAGLLFLSYAIALKLPLMKETKMLVPLFPADLIKRNAPVYSAMLIRHTGASMIWVTYPLFLASIGADIGWIGMIYAVNAFGQFFIMNYLDKYDPASLVAIGLAMSGATFYMFLLASNFWEIIPSQVALALAWSCLYVGSVRYVLDSNKEKATAAGILSSVTSISGVVGPVLGGLAVTLLDFKGTIAIATVMSFIAFAIFVNELRKTGELYRLRPRSWVPR